MKPLKRMMAVLIDGEDKTDFLREAVQEALERRERAVRKPKD